MGAAGAAVTGATDWYRLRGGSLRRIGATHAALHSTATILYGAWPLLRGSGVRGTGKLGGLLGYGAWYPVRGSAVT